MKSRISRHSPDLLVSTASFSLWALLSLLSSKETVRVRIVDLVVIFERGTATVEMEAIVIVQPFRSYRYRREIQVEKLLKVQSE